jgi:hypothetical protein
MEYGLRLETQQDLLADPREACRAPWRDLLPEGRLAALYFGTEFCEDRLPEVEEAAPICALARDHEVEAVLLTPVVTDEGLRRVVRLLGDLQDRGWQPAVVFNDWGALDLLRRQFPSHPRRAGRLLNRALRDPRAAGEPPASATESRGQRLRRLLVRLGAVALESDPDQEGGYLGDGAEGLQRALHLPYAFATSGRNCLVKAAADPETQGFIKGLGTGCSGPCRAGPLIVEREDTPTTLWRAGNTIFSEVSRARAAAHLTGADRVVLHARPAP